MNKKPINPLYKFTLVLLYSSEIKIQFQKNDNYIRLVLSICVNITSIIIYKIYQIIRKNIKQYKHRKSIGSKTVCLRQCPHGKMFNNVYIAYQGINYVE